MSKKTNDKWQFGDFQTPEALAKKITSMLKEKYSLEPQVVIEPSCGKGAFIRAAIDEFDNSKIMGFDIKSSYIEEAKSSLNYDIKNQTVELKTADFFNTGWQDVIAKQTGYILILGNPPWVTSSELSILNSQNCPKKSNFQNRRGIEAITGSGNFDISEWMLLQYLQWLSKRDGAIAVLCKYSVARKIIGQINHKFKQSFTGAIHRIDAKHYFDAAVDACLFVLYTGNDDAQSLEFDVYETLESSRPIAVIGEQNGWMISNLVTYNRWSHLAGQDLRYTWRSGIKHDCAKVMELERVEGNLFRNGLNEEYCLEDKYLFPLLKSSDLGNGKTKNYRKLVLVTQSLIGEDTQKIKIDAPRTWRYLSEHINQLNARKSSIYKNKPPYSIFGVGSYTFKKWKVAISGLYKKLNFCLIEPLDKKAVVFDDTVNFLYFETQAEAEFIYILLTSKPALEFLDSMIFWDEKRPVTINILKRLSLQSVAEELGKLAEYRYWARTVQVGQNGQLVLGLVEK